MEPSDPDQQNLLERCCAEDRATYRGEQRRDLLVCGIEVGVAHSC
jgi:hypothetical protein